MGKYGGVSGRTGSGSDLDPKLEEKILRKRQSKEAQERADESSSTGPKIVEYANKREREIAEAQALAIASGTNKPVAETKKELDAMFSPNPTERDVKDQTRIQGALTDEVLSGKEILAEGREDNLKWEYKNADLNTVKDDGGFISRAVDGANKILAGLVRLPISSSNIPTEIRRDFGMLTQQEQLQKYNPMTQRAMSDAVVESRKGDLKKKYKGSLVSAAAASGAVEVNSKGQQVPNRNWLMTGLAMVEHAFADWSFLSTDAESSLDEYGGTLDQKALRRRKDLIELGVDITKARGNYSLGQKIHQEFQRNSGQEITKLSQADAAMLGDMFKELYYELHGARINPAYDIDGNPIRQESASDKNPNPPDAYSTPDEKTRVLLPKKTKGTTTQHPSLYEVESSGTEGIKTNAMLTRDQQENGETIFTLTPHGKRIIMDGRTRREITFGKDIVKPLTTPLDDSKAMSRMDTILQESRGQMVGEKRYLTKRVLGKIRSLFVGKQLDNAMTNASSMAHAVNDDRLKIGMTMFFNSLLGTADEAHLLDQGISWQAEGLGLGRTKTFEYQTEERLSEKELAPFRNKWNNILRNYFEEHPNFDMANMEDRRRVKELNQDKMPPELKAEYRAEAVLRQQRTKLAQELHATIEGRNKANYLTYSTLGFNQRILPQQTYFNFVTSKLVRAITCAVRPDFIESIEAEAGLRQGYAMHLLPSRLSADKKMPLEREKLLQQYEARLNAWGERLSQASTLDDASFNQLSQLINDKVAIADIQQQYPALIEAARNNLKLDPNNDFDAELLAELMEQGQEAIQFVDGLIDFSKYYKAKGGGIGSGLDYKGGKKFSTYFNFHIDGMTNGIASNGFQMGDLLTAMRTGVLRIKGTDLLEEGDVRDILIREAPKVITDDPFEIVMSDKNRVTEATQHLERIALNVLKNKALHKDTTMTYGYGKELESFWVNFIDALEMQYTKYEWQVANAEKLGLDVSEVADRNQYIASMDYINRKIDGKSVFDATINGQQVEGLEAAAKLINQKYKSSLTKVMSDQGIQSRALMRGTAAMFAAMDERWVMEGPTQMLEFGKDVSLGYTHAMKDHRVSTYNLYREDLEKKGVKKGALQRKSAMYAVRSSAAATRVKRGKKRPGDWAWGGSLPGPIQAIDAAVVARTLTGRSFEKIKQANKGNPYVATIYDAFKGTANNYWAVLEEVNNNWALINKEYSYLHAAKNSLNKTKKIWDAEMDKRIKENPNKLVDHTESLYMNYVLEWDSDSESYKNLKSLISSLYVKQGYDRTDPISRKQAEDTMVLKFDRKLSSLGYIMGAKRGRDYTGQVVNPPVTVKQLKAFVDIFYDMLGKEVTVNGKTTESSFLDRINEMAVLTDKQKKIMFDLMKSKPRYDESGNKINDGRQGHRTPSGMWIPLQYYGA